MGSAVAPHVWTGRPDRGTMMNGLIRDHAQQEAFDGYAANVDAPECPSCKRPVRDDDIRRHLHEAHGVLYNVRPYGKPDAREALFRADTLDELAQAIADWRARHPGVRLAPMAEGTDRDLGDVWARFRQIDARGRAAQ